MKKIDLINAFAKDFEKFIHNIIRIESCIDNGEVEVSINYLDFDQNKITYTLFELYSYGEWRVNCTNSRTISEIIGFKEDES